MSTRNNSICRGSSLLDRVCNDLRDAVSNIWSTSTKTNIGSFLAFGVGLDPRCGQLFGPRMGPLLVGCVLGLTVFASVGLADGYPGAGLNPARCFAFAVARNDFERMRFISLVCGAPLTECRPMDMVDWSFHRRNRAHHGLPYCSSLPSGEDRGKSNFKTWGRNWEGLKLLFYGTWVARHEYAKKRK